MSSVIHQMCFILPLLQQNIHHLLWPDSTHSGATQVLHLLIWYWYLQCPYHMEWAYYSLMLRDPVGLTMHYLPYLNRLRLTSTSSQFNT